MKRTTKRAKPKKPATGGKTKTPVESSTPPSVALGESAKADVTSPISPPRPQKRQGGTTSFIFAVLLLAVIGGAGAATWPFWSPHIKRFFPALESESLLGARVNDVSERIKALEAKTAANLKDGNVIQDLIDERNSFAESLNGLMNKLQSLEEDLKSVKLMVEATAPPLDAANANQSLQRLAERFEKIEKSGETLENILQRMNKFEEGISVSQVGQAAKNDHLSAAIDEISERVGAFEKKEIKTAPKGAPKIILSVGQLREALRVSAPFSKELAALKTMAGDGSEISRSLKNIEPYASSGVPTLDSLSRRFAEVALLIDGPPLAAPGEGWLGRAMNRLSSLISVRRVDSQSDTAITQAGKRLKEGNLAAAVQAIGKFASTSPKVSAWLDDARARLTVEQSIAALHVFAISLLTPESGKAQ
ncbi:MAG: hypothetical protein V3R66_03880 [Rhodospirillales bacterium]